MNKYKLSTKIRQKVNKISINIPSGGGSTCGDLYKEGVHVCELKIVHQTPYKIALNDRWITVLDRQKEGDRKDDYKHFLEQIDVSIKTKETYWTNGIFATMYTIGSVDSAIRKMTKEMQKKVNKEYGFLFNVDIKSKVEKYLNN